jgi:hypothetical protein
MKPDDFKAIPPFDLLSDEQRQRISTNVISITIQQISKSAKVLSGILPLELFSISTSIFAPHIAASDFVLKVADFLCPFFVTITRQLSPRLEMLAMKYLCYTIGVVMV